MNQRILNQRIQPRQTTRRHFLPPTRRCSAPRWPGRAPAGPPQRSRPSSTASTTPAKTCCARREQDIERIRKGDFAVRFAAANGQPIRGEVELRHVGHEFRFGGPFSEHPLFLDLCNAGRINPHWSVIQKADDGPDGPYQWEHFDKMFDAAAAHELSMRWHCLIYEEHGTPKWIDAKFRDKPWWNDVPETEEQWWLLIERHIREVGTHRRPCDGKPLGEFVEFDVINETGSKLWTNERLEAAGKPACFPSSHNRHPRGWSNAARMIVLARRYMPASRLVALEPWPMGDLENGMTKRVLRHFATLLDGNSSDPLVRQVANDSDLLLGYQGHTGPHDRRAILMSQIDRGFERFAQLGKGIVITEYDPPCVPKEKSEEEFARIRLSPEEQAAWSVNFHTLAFSKPYLSELMRWSWADGQGMKRDAGILFANHQPKPEYAALKQLLKETWTTRWQGALDADGTARFRGYFGVYEARLPGGRTTRFKLLSGGNRTATVTL